jgi:hypothetical protein
MAELTPKYIDVTNQKALVMLARADRPSPRAVNSMARRRPNHRSWRQNRMDPA